MSKKLLIVLAIAWIMALSGCSKEEDIDYTLIKDNININQISLVEIEKDIYIKNTTDIKEIDELISFIGSIEYLKGDFENISDSEDIIRIKLYDQKDALSKSLSISEEAAYYNKKWYPIDKQIYVRILSIYNSLKAEEIEDENLMDTKQRQSVRNSKSVLEALQGTWLGEDKSTLKFDSIYLTQGDKFEFNYTIEDINDNYIDIRAYGNKGILTKGEELFSLNIIMDYENTRMLVKKTMFGGLIYYERYIYVDNGGTKVGTFDSHFFIRHSFDQ